MLFAQRISGEKDFKLHFCLKFWLIIWKKEENFSCILGKLLNIIKIIDISTTFTN